MPAPPPYFRREPLEKVSAKAGAHHYGEELRESAMEEAERLVAAELHRRGWQPANLETKRRGDTEKVIMAERLRQATTMRLVWIAERLHMGTRTHLAHLLYWSRRNRQGQASRKNNTIACPLCGYPP